METNYKKTMIWKNVTEKRRNDLLTNSDKFKDVKLIIKGPLKLKGCTSLISLPDGLQVEGDLILENCPSLTSLPDGLQVGGNLFVANTPFAKYTDGELLKMIGSNGFIKGIIKR